MWTGNVFCLDGETEMQKQETEEQKILEGADIDEGDEEVSTLVQVKSYRPIGIVCNNSLEKELYVARRY